MRALVLSLALVISGVSAIAAATELYRWVDEDGVVHYSDRPREGAERVTIQPAQTFSAPALPQPAPAAEPAEGEASVYQELLIASPAEEETVWNIENQLPVSLTVAPAVQRGHRFALFLDGERVDGVPARATDFVISDVFRGEHTLRAVVEDQAGNELARSPTRRFFVQRGTTANPPVGPAPRPGGSVTSPILPGGSP